jgi:hypothetical protein
MILVFISFSNLIAGPSLSRSFLHAQVMIISCAFQKNWDFSGRIPMKTFFLVRRYFNLVRQPFDCSSFFGSRFATWSGPFPYKSKNLNKI